MTVNSYILKGRIQDKTRQRERWGLRAPRPAPGPEALDPLLAKLHGCNSPSVPRVPLGLRKVWGFWPKKARENPRGKACFPLRIIPWLSPDAKHPGLAAKGRRARSTTIQGLQSTHLQATAGTTLSQPTKQLPRLRVQGTQYPGGVWGKAPPFSFSNSVT